MKKKKRVLISKQGNHGINYHIKHKSKLTFLLFVKILSVLFSFSIGVILYLFINSIFGVILSALISFAVACFMYLLLIMKALRLINLK